MFIGLEVLHRRRTFWQNCLFWHNQKVLSFFWNARQLYQHFCACSESFFVSYDYSILDYVGTCEHLFHNDSACQRHYKGCVPVSLCLFWSYLPPVCHYSTMDERPSLIRIIQKTYFPGGAAARVTLQCLRHPHGEADGERADRLPAGRRECRCRADCLMSLRKRMLKSIIPFKRFGSETI